QGGSEPADLLGGDPTKTASLEDTLKNQASNVDALSLHSRSEDGTSALGSLHTVLQGGSVGGGDTEGAEDQPLAPGTVVFGTVTGDQRRNRRSLAEDKPDGGTGDGGDGGKGPSLNKNENDQLRELDKQEEKERNRGKDGGTKMPWDGQI